MRATEILRNLLDIIDGIEADQETPDVEINLGVADNTEEERRMAQIADLLPCDDDQGYANAPRERVAGIEAVTTGAGDGWMGPKHPADIKADSVSMYPNHLHKPG